MRDDPRPRAGLIRVREFVMKDSYSPGQQLGGFGATVSQALQAYFRIFERCALPVMAVLSDTGMMGGRIAHEFMYASEVGEDTILYCPDCGYSANRQIAQFRKPKPSQETALELEEIATPNCRTIAELSQFLQVEASRCAKMVFFVASWAKADREADKDRQKLVAAVLPGDMELNEAKLLNLLGAKELRPAEVSEILASGPCRAMPRRLA